MRPRARAAPPSRHTQAELRARFLAQAAAYPGAWSDGGAERIADARGGGSEEPPDGTVR